MKKLFVIIFIFLMGTTYIYAFTWDNCIERYEKARQFSNNVRLSYNYLKSTKKCLVKFKESLTQNPNSDFTVEAMDDNILMLEKYIENLLPQYNYPNNYLKQVPRYIQVDSKQPKPNKEYKYFKKFKNCNGVHANDKIYTAKHCNIKDSKNIKYDLNYIETQNVSKLETSKLDLNKVGTFKYYSMSKEGMFYNTLLQENNCKFYKSKSTISGQNKTLDLADLEKKEEIRSTCVAIPSNSGGGVFQDGNLVGIISKTVFNENEFLYSVIEPIYPF